MEGPTLVSASIHAATMVTAGIFMIAKCSPLFEYPPMALIVITSAGATTSFLAVTTRILENDLKRNTYKICHCKNDNGNPTINYFVRCTLLDMGLGEGHEIIIKLIPIIICHLYHGMLSYVLQGIS